MRIGTSYFVSEKAAVSYYCMTLDAIREKVAAGEIHTTGKPALKAGERLVLLDGGRRYGIESDE